MAENAQQGICYAEYNEYDVEEESDDESEDEEREEVERCLKINIADNIAAYLEKRELLRDTEAISCSSDLMEKVTNNYVIAKKILSNLSWQDKLICKHVCTTWHSAIHTLRKEQISPVDFVIDLQPRAIRNGIKYKKSSKIYTEPLVIFTFTNSTGFITTSKCNIIVPSPCTPSCEKEHCLIDVVQRYVSTPKDCMLSIQSNYISYMPLPQSITYEHTLSQRMFMRSNPFISGVYIPSIQDVKFEMINIEAAGGNTLNDFFEIVDNLSQTQIIKGVLVYVTDNYLLHSVEDIVFLNYFKDVQPNIPYALGGCIVEDAMFRQNDINPIIDSVNANTDYVSENMISIGIFTVPKNRDNTDENVNFDMYSLIIESSDWTKVKIQKTINEFSKKVPKFEHSVVIKLSCVGRDQKHELEQDYFRAAFPNTRLIGCYGNGELGVNHPPKPQAEELPNTAKRHRRDPGPQFGIMYSYSTVFVYIGWGKILAPPEN